MPRLPSPVRTGPVRTGALLLAGMIGLAATGAIAADRDMVVAGQSQIETRTMPVSFADLNLASAHGRHVLDARISKAARDVCDIQLGSALNNLPSAKSCYKGAREGAISQLDSHGLGGTIAVSAGGLR